MQFILTHCQLMSEASRASKVWQALKRRLASCAAASACSAHGQLKLCVVQCKCGIPATAQQRECTYIVNMSCEFLDGGSKLARCIESKDSLQQLAQSWLGRSHMCMASSVFTGEDTSTMLQYIVPWPIMLPACIELAAL